MKIEISHISADWREDVCCRCGLDCNPEIRVSYNSIQTGNRGNYLFDDEFGLCRFCLSKVLPRFRDIEGGFEIPAVSEIESPKRDDWLKIEKEIREGFD